MGLNDTLNGTGFTLTGGVAWYRKLKEQTIGHFKSTNTGLFVKQFIGDFVILTIMLVIVLQLG